MRIWTFDKTKKDRIRNETSKKWQGESIEDKLREYRMRWFGTSRCNSKEE